MIPKNSNKLSTKCASPEDWPNEFTVNTDNIVHAEAIFLLINAGYTSGYQDKRIGVIDVSFDNGKLFSYYLGLGYNIREWNIQAADAVSTISSPDVTEIYRGINRYDSVSVLDMLRVVIPDQYRNERLSSIRLRDLSEETVGSQNPCFFITGITVRARD